jgi:hypothetical protein
MDLPVEDGDATFEEYADVNVNGRPWDDAPPMGRPEAYQTVTLGDGSSVFRTFESARITFYADCDPQDAAWAFERLSIASVSTSRRFPAHTHRS